jgi:hypothetical protein
MEQAPLLLVWLADLSRIERIAAERHASVDAANSLDIFVMSVIDAALAAQNAVVALESLGLASCYIGGIRNRPREVAGLLSLPPHAAAIFGLCVGYENPAATAIVKPRLPQTAVLHREQYSCDPERDAIATHNAALATHWRAQGSNPPDWTEIVINRLKAGDALHGRQHLREMLNSLGFELR